MDRRALAATTAALTGIAAGAAFAYANRPVPLLTMPLAAAPDRESAIERFGALVALDESEDIDPLCASRLLDHGHRTERSVVLFHGYTNCPLQLAMLGDLLFEVGYNVLIPRVPRQGLMDKMTDEISLLRSDELAEFAANAAGIAAGLGERLTVFGFSGGGTLASYVAHQMDEVAEAILVAPLVGMRVVPNGAVRAVYRFTKYAPEHYMWWNPIERGEGPYSPRAYPRFSTRSLSAYLRLALGLYDAPPARTRDLQRVVLILNENDFAVDNGYATRFVEAVLGPRSGYVESMLFPRRMGLHHDWLDPLGADGEILERGYVPLLAAMGV
jgi:carboxylesterase